MSGSRGSRQPAMADITIADVGPGIQPPTLPESSTPAVTCPWRQLIPGLEQVIASPPTSYTTSPASYGPLRNGY
ncbi:hypothetical protein N7510_010557 [Penicillium lagena]|uniref:uncharacterized protein n=1 Tax=Penicillium lagena TaxID=94218 RepID=UPI00253F6E22|nr:uncharacterized protein N7510_010557 [Penicillium lagena]KAJ5601023.1 hypothetical protein N7510_010557 [Penicillium lagena]